MNSSFLSRTRVIAVLSTLLCCAQAIGQESFTYEDIAKRHADSKLSVKVVEEAKMQGECLVGLKQLNFKKIEGFDPVAEWTSFRSLSLLEQFPPCTVLIMMEVARAELLEEAQ